MKTTPKDATQWSVRAMAAAQKVSSATAQRILPMPRICSSVCRKVCPVLSRQGNCELSNGVLNSGAARRSQPQTPETKSLRSLQATGSTLMNAARDDSATPRRPVKG
jgi:hypothetical protein